MVKARYTVVLKTLLDDAKTKELIDKALSTYPMYVPQNGVMYSIIPTREELNKKLLNHFRYREIAFETPGRFIEELEITMCEIMPYYYQMFKSEDIMNAIEDPFGNVDVTETYESETTGTNKDTVKSESENTSNKTSDSNVTVNNESQNNQKHVTSDTPQNSLSINSKDIDSVDYASQIEWNEDINTSEESTSGTATEQGTDRANASSESNTLTSGTSRHSLTKKGNQGVNTYAHDMGELRTIFMNIVQDIINDERIQELFMMVY